MPGTTLMIVPLQILCRWAAAEDGLEIGRPEGAGHEAREGVDRNTGDDENAERGQRLEQAAVGERSEEHTSELQSLMRISYAVFCLKKKIINMSKHIHDLESVL